MRTTGFRLIALIGAAAVTTTTVEAVSSAVDRIEVIAPGITVEFVCDATPGAGTGCRIGAPGIETPLTDLLQPKAGLDPHGRLLTFVGSEPFLCGSGAAWNLTMVRVLEDLQTTQPVLRILTTCDGNIQERSNVTGLLVDLVGGTALVAVETLRLNCATVFCSEEERIIELLRVRNVGSLLEILLTYEPPATLSFNVPTHPEGLPAAESFSVWSGDAGALPDLSAAMALDCSVPAGRAPVPGEILKAADSTPVPAPGEAVYFLVAAEHQGRRRAGRTYTQGTLTGRNAAALTGCP